MNILTLDTSASCLELLLTKDGESVKECYEEVGPRISALFHKTLASMLEDVGLTVRQLDLIIGVKGPGSFTGIRVGLAAAKTIGQCLGIPVLGLDTLHLLAFRHFRQHSGPVLAAVNTFRDEVYIQSFDGQGEGCRPTGDVSLISLGQLWLKNDAPPIIMRRIPNRHQRPLTLPADIEAPSVDGNERLLADAAELGSSLFRNDVAAVETHTLDPLYVKADVMPPARKVV